jgi:hypothetical protein
MRGLTCTAWPRELLPGGTFAQGVTLAVIASEAKQFRATETAAPGLLRRFAPRNDGVWGNIRGKHKPAFSRRAAADRDGQASSDQTICQG